MSNKVVFRLKRLWRDNDHVVDLYHQIKSGRKTVEYRDASQYWLKRLCRKVLDVQQMPLDLASAKGALIILDFFLKVKRVWFLVGFPKNSVPRLEANITHLHLDPRNSQLHIHFANVEEKTK